MKKPSVKGEVSMNKMLKKTELIIREASNYLNNYIYGINNFRLNLVEHGNSSLCLKAEVFLI